MADWIEHDGKRYFEQGYLDLANANTARALARAEKAEAELASERAGAAALRLALEELGKSAMEADLYGSHRLWSVTEKADAGASLLAAHEKDYADMRRFQADFIRRDQECRKLASALEDEIHVRDGIIEALAPLDNGELVSEGPLEMAQRISNHAQGRLNGLEIERAELLEAAQPFVKWAALISYMAPGEEIILHGSIYGDEEFRITAQNVRRLAEVAERAKP